VDAGQAVLWIDPHAYCNDARLHDIEARARAHTVPLVILKQTDDLSPTRTTYGIVYRDSIYGTRQTPLEHAMPALCDDPAYAVPTPVRAYHTTPAIGFCGYTGIGVMLPIYRAMGKTEKAVGLSLRRRALAALSSTPGLSTRFITRTQFWGGALGLQSRRMQSLLRKLSGRSTADLHATRDLERERAVYHEFLDNVVGTDYTLCARGAGNFSYRFYETLAAGRIPLMIDTDCVLPFADEIDWARHCCIVPERELKNIGAHLKAFHAALNADSFAQLQRANRTLWETHLSPAAAMHKIIEATLRRSRALL
jgi:hypothetical protein